MKPKYKKYQAEIGLVLFSMLFVSMIAQGLFLSLLNNYLIFNTLWVVFLILDVYTINLIAKFSES